MELKPVIIQQSIISDCIAGLRAIDEANKELRERNERRVAAVKVRMGRKYLLHPDNAPKKQAYVTVLAHGAQE